MAWKEPCRVATTASITIASDLNAGDTIDGVTLAAGDRVLVKDQGTGSQNGIYIAGATPARAFDMDQDSTTSVPASEVMGAIVYVIAGTTNGGTLWRNTNTTAPTLGSTSLTFSAVSSGSGAPTTADYLVGTSQAGLSAEIVVGTTPGGELGGTWASPTVDATHAGSTHIALSSATPLVESGAGSAGSGTAASKDDHVHPAAGGSGTLSTVKDEGTNLSTAVTSIDFVGAGVTATGTTAVTVTIPGGGGSGGLTLLEQHTASASATLDFTTCISSTYDEYLIEFINILNATNGAAFWMRAGTGAGPTYDTGANYSHATYVWNGGGAAASGANGATAMVLNYNASADGLSNALSNWSYNGHIRLFNPGGSAYKFISGQIVYVDSIGGNRSSCQLQGSYESTTAMTAFQFLMSSGNITSGTIRVYGLAK